MLADAEGRLDFKLGRARGRVTTYRIRPIATPHRTMVEASAAPTAPSSGRLQWPQINSQLRNRLAMLAKIIATSAGIGRRVDSR